jgi:integrase
MKHPPKSLSVTLMSRAKINKKWIRRNAVYGKSGRVKPGLLIINGKEIICEEVAYEIRYYKNGQARYLPAGRNASEAEAKRRTFAAQLTATAIAHAAGVTVVEATDRKAIKVWGREYLTKKSVLVGRDQHQQYRYVIQLFSECCTKSYLDELTETDIVAFMKYLTELPVYRSNRVKPSQRSNAIQRRQRCPSEHRTISRRSVFSYYIKARTWLCEGGVDRKIFPPPPKYEEKEVTIYTPQEIEQFFSLVTGNLRIATLLMLKCGLRYREAICSCFSDINFNEKTILVRGKPEYKFKVKNYQQRYVPIPDDAAEELRRWAEEHSRQRLLIQFHSGKPVAKLLQHLKRFVFRHGLRCGNCAHCLSGNPECENWGFHKFRRTYITAILRHVDLRTAQSYAGHKRISATERYLRPGTAIDGQKRVSAIDFTKPFYE